MTEQLTDLEHVQPPVFSERDPRFDRLLEQWDHLESGKKERIIRLLKTNVGKVPEQVIAVRSQDIITTLLELIEGSTSVHKPEDKDIPLMDKPEDMFFTQAIGNNPFFQKERPELFLNPSIWDKKLYESLMSNITLYSKRLAFATAFSENVVPVLKEGWLEVFTDGLNVLYGTDDIADREPLTPALAFENFVDYLGYQCTHVGKTNISMQEVRNRGDEFWAINLFLETIQPHIELERVYTFLVTASLTRGGVLIGFNQELLKMGEVVTVDKPHPIPKYNANMFVDPTELIIHPPNGTIPFDGTVVAFEQLEAEVETTYEDNVLSELGIA